MTLVGIVGIVIGVVIGFLVGCRAERSASESQRWKYDVLSDEVDRLEEENRKLNEENDWLRKYAEPLKGIIDLTREPPKRHPRIATESANCVCSCELNDCMCPVSGCYDCQECECQCYN